MKTAVLLLLTLLLSGLDASAQREEEKYIPDPNPRIQQRIGQALHSSL